MNTLSQFKEIEVRFLEVNKEDLIKRLLDLGAIDHGEKLLKETIFYHKDKDWATEKKFVRIRDNGGEIHMTYKKHVGDGTSLEDVDEIEITVSDNTSAHKFLEAMDLCPYRKQEKRRHTFTLDDIVFDFDSWPQIPTYMEIEGADEKKLKDMAEKIGLDWQNVHYENAKKVIENVYNIPVGTLSHFTFDKIE